MAQSTLENTVNWYFSLENLRRADDAVGELTIHRTHTHGFPEVNFAVTYLMQAAFAPRT